MVPRPLVSPAGAFRIAVLFVLLSFLAACGAAPPGGMGSELRSSTSTQSTAPPSGGVGTPETAPPGGMSGGGKQEATPYPTPTTPTPEPPSPTPTAATVAGTATPESGAYSTPTPAPTDTPIALSTPAGTLPMQITLELPASVQRGSTVTVNATVSPVGSVCTLTVKYRPASDIPAFTPERVGPSGTVSWSWMINSGIEPGDWPVTVRCENGQPPTSPLYHYVYATNLLSIR
ncbi:MAG: hypothetical protein M1118_14985 [Chloroflexi bacterium]|nr:hypothetical protein [Chloroflexota bacterium]